MKKLLFCSVFLVYISCVGCAGTGEYLTSKEGGEAVADAAGGGAAAGLAAAAVGGPWAGVVAGIVYATQAMVSGYSKWREAEKQRQKERDDELMEAPGRP